MKNKREGNTININKLTIGSEVIVNHKIYGDITFICIGENHDGKGTVTLLTKYVVDRIGFDAKEPNSPDCYRETYGNNRYLHSNIHQWMNSSDDEDVWYKDQHPSDQAPNSSIVTSLYPYAFNAGLLHGFTKEFRSQLVTVRKRTARNIISDGGRSELVHGKVFLLSTTEIGLEDENNIAEGKIYEYFAQNNTNEQRIAYPSPYCLINTAGYVDDIKALSTPCYWGLRTPNSRNTYSIRGVDLRGELGYPRPCYSNIGLRFAVCIANK